MFFDMKRSSLLGCLLILAQFGAPRSLLAQEPATSPAAEATTGPQDNKGGTESGKADEGTVNAPTADFGAMPGLVQQLRQALTEKRTDDAKRLMDELNSAWLSQRSKVTNKSTMKSIEKAMTNLKTNVGSAKGKTKAKAINDTKALAALDSLEKAIGKMP